MLGDAIIKGGFRIAEDHLQASFFRLAAVIDRGE
jgi:hypothetical protein